ncbi:uncharacterized protein BJ212DRAFT_1298659 [Suillus subaureus]|uniref:Uncharacterized protein n=1 Tax=Suillus subaureus TaxID=48587 RepID=A0A9P7JEJ1_9AGAM|nr:uncharacterized protein BJ212DRAFT_1298659 [Suillus subaureus]KAG1818579.1 hypothetical protein BJ212DRAFT_1298659 [Suillus subaureus]
MNCVHSQGSTVVPFEMQNDQQAVAYTSYSVSADHSQGHVPNIADDILPGSLEGRVHLQTGIDYLVSTSLLDTLGICNMVAGHLKNKNNHSIATHKLDELTKYCIDNNIYGRQEEVKLPAPGGPVIQMICLPHVGIACTMLTDYLYAVCNLDTMKRHARQVHGHAPTEARTLLMQNFHSSLDVPVIPETLTPEEQRPLLKVMLWDTFMVDVWQHPREVKAVETLKGKHHQEEHHGLFKAIGTLVVNHFHIASTILNGNPNKLTIAKTLLDGRNITCQSQGVQSLFLFSLDVTQTKALDTFIGGMVSSNMSINDQNIKEFHKRTVTWAKSTHPSIFDFKWVLAIHNEVLAVGHSNTFNMLFQYQQFALSLALNQQRELKVFFDPGFQWLSVGADRMHITAFHQGIQMLLQQVEDRYLLLTKGCVAFNSMPNNLNDDMTNTIQRDSFAKDKQFGSGSQLGYDGWRWTLWMECASGQRHPVMKWGGMETIVPLALCHWSNLHGQELILLSGYSKTTQIADRDSCTPVFINPKVGLFLFEFLAGRLRDTEAILAKVGYGNAAHHEYKMYLVVENGSRIKPDGIWNLSKGTARFSTACGVSEGMDHSMDTDKNHYGILYGSMPELTNNTMLKHHWLSEEWQVFCGLGPFPPQEPIQQKRTRSAHSQSAQGDGQLSPDLAGMSKTVSTIASSAVTKLLQDNLPCLLKELATTTILPPILDTLQQCTAALTVLQDHPFSPHKLSSVQTPARQGGSGHVWSGGCDIHRSHRECGPN